MILDRANFRALILAMFLAGSVLGTGFESSAGFIPPFDFMLTVAPPSQSVNQGQSIQYQVQVSQTSGIVQQMVTLSLVWQPFQPLGVTFPFVPPSFLTGSWISTLTVTTSATTWPGVYTLQIKGTGGGQTHTIPVTLTVTAVPPPQPDLAIASIWVNPPAPRDGDTVVFYAMVVNQGAATANNIRVDCHLDGVQYATGTISSLIAGASQQISTATPWIAAQGLHTLRWVVDPFNAIAESNENNNDMSMPFSVGPPPFDFTVSATPTSQSVSQGQTATYQVSVTLVTGPPTTVALSLSGNPTGTAPIFVQQSGTATFNTRLDMTTTSGTPPGTYTLTIMGTGGSPILTRTFQVTLIVVEKPDFTISVTPMSQTILQGRTTTYAVSITSLGGFSGTVALSLSGLPLDATHTFSPITASTTSTLTITAGEKTGTFSITISGTGGSLSITRITTATLIVEVDPERQRAKEAIEAAQDAINRAEREGRNVGLDDARARLREAEAAYKKWDHARAKSLAEQARDMAEKAQSFIQAYGLYIAVGTALTAGAVVAVMMRKKLRLPKRALPRRKIKTKAKK